MKSKVTAYLTLFIIGSIILLAVGYRLYDLYAVSQEMVHTSGIVSRIDSKKVYRLGRKSTYRYTAHLEYQVDGRIERASVELHHPFLSEGSEISLWYHPSYRREIILPSQEYFMWGIAGFFGVICFLFGIILVKTKE